MKRIWEMNKHILIPNTYIILLANEKEIEERLSKRETFSKFEKKMSRAEEIKYFIKAINYLKQKGFNILQLNNNKGDLEKNIFTIIKLIEKEVLT